jgi:ATP-dependent RNA helicase DeaD
MESFRKLGLSEEIIKSIEEARFKEPSEIQVKTIPLVVGGKDVIGGSATGSGKTLAFGAGMIQKAIRGGGMQALILTPTRELAEQVAQSLAKFSKYHGLKVSAVYGGVAMSPQIEALRYSEIVVGTPGRILDHMRQGTIELKKIKTLVLDEADRMLDMGFIEDVETIIKACPKERQTLLFSATISPDIAHIAKFHMKNPVEVSVESYVDPSLLEQIFYDIPKEQKFSLLVHLLKHENEGLVMIFCNTRQNADFVSRNLKLNGINAIAIHGGLSQSRRTSIMSLFRKGEVYALVCTDVAARGLDIKGISHIYNYDSPKTSKEYIHRIGRTARAGKEGKAVSLVANRDYENFRRVLEDSSLIIKKEEAPADIERAIMRVHEDRGERRGGFGGRGGGRSFGGQRREGGFSRGSGGFRGRGESRGGFGGQRREGGFSSGSRGFGRSGGRREGGFSSSSRGGGRRGFSRGGARGGGRRGFSRGRERRY